MLAFIQKSMKVFRKEPSDERIDLRGIASETAALSHPIEIDIDPDDPILTYFASASGVVEIDKLQFESAALSKMKSAGVKLAVPLVSQGELIGLLNLGSRRSEQEYSSDDRRLLNNLATQAAPVLRVAQLARQQQIEARERERLEQELRVARVIQQTLLPKKLPDVPGYQLAAYWQPARAVSGDFYDFWEFPDGKLGIIVADVTDKGVPAALVMATTRTLLREAAEHFRTPGKVLERANELLVPDIPHNMFVTCLYILLDPQTGECVLANAGHNLPIKYAVERTEEIRVRGMPLGLIPGMRYEEQLACLTPGEGFMLYSDGLIEAHNPQEEMFETPRLLAILPEHSSGTTKIQASLDALAAFTGPNWEQEDDVTLVTIERQKTEVGMVIESENDEGLILIDEFEVVSSPGNERTAMQRVGELAAGFDFSQVRLERLKTAVAETTMNAMEHGNKYQTGLNVLIRAYKTEDSLLIRIRDHGGGKTIPEHVIPDLDAKLDGLQSPRGWGLFLIENMVDEMHVHTDDRHHTVELRMKFRE